jgi:putative flippase GtrA
MTTPPVLDVVVPVHNEQAALGASVHRLRDHLQLTFPYPFRITVADNASTDSTWAVAGHLVEQLPEVRAVHLDQKGRGRALKAVWSASEALILAYMDVDLSTDLDALWPLVAPLMSGHSDLAIGSRLAHGSRVVRGPRRELISRAYNVLLRRSLGARFTDAQCGFKAIRGDVAAELLPMVQDPAWFFDTELLVLAERCGLRIHEVPVDWYDDPDSRVDVLRTAIEDLHGIVRLRRTIAAGRLPLAAVRERIGRHHVEAGLLDQVWRFAGVGLASTALHLGLFAWLAAALPSAQTANLLALLLATVANTAANRRWTFGVRGRHGLGRQHLQALAVFGLTWAMSSAALLLVGSITSRPGAALQTAAIAVANLAATVVRFVLMRRWIFSTDNPSAGTSTGAPAATVLEDVIRRPRPVERQSA